MRDGRDANPKLDAMFIIRNYVLYYSYNIQCQKYYKVWLVIVRQDEPRTVRIY